jgi:predicted transcriptional regulator
VLAAALPVWALYRRTMPSGAMHHPVREEIVRRVRERPGIHESQLARDMGLGHTHVQYHLRVLTDAGVVEVRRFGGLKCIFELGRHSQTEKALAMSDRGRTKDLLAIVAAEPGIAQRGLAKKLGMSDSSVKWHLQRLEGAGLVSTERARGMKRVWLAQGLPPPLPPPAGAMPLPASAAPQDGLFAPVPAGRPQ